MGPQHTDDGGDDDDGEDDVMPRGKQFDHAPDFAHALLFFGPSCQLLIFLWESGAFPASPTWIQIFPPGLDSLSSCSAFSSSCSCSCSCSSSSSCSFFRCCCGSPRTVFLAQDSRFGPKMPPGGSKTPPRSPKESKRHPKKKQKAPRGPQGPIRTSQMPRHPAKKLPKAPRQPNRPPKSAATLTANCARGLADVA